MSQKKAANFPGHNTPTKRQNAMSECAKERHKRVAKSLGYVLTLGAGSSWHELTIVLMARLTEAGCASLAFATLNSLSAGHTNMAASAALFGTLNGDVL